MDPESKFIKPIIAFKRVLLPEEPVPIIQTGVSGRTEKDISFKMTLLLNFTETFFKTIVFFIINNATISHAHL